VVPDLVAEACGRLGISPVRDAFATSANHRFPAYWTREDDAFAQPWDYATAGHLWANPPVQSPGGGGDEGGPEGLPHAGHRPGFVRPPIPVFGRVVCPVPQTVAAPAGPARAPAAAGTDLMPAPRWRTWVFLLRRGQIQACPNHPRRSSPKRWPPGVGGVPGRGPGCTTHGGTPPQRHTAPRELARPGGAQSGRATLPSNGASRERPHHPVHSQAPPLLAGPPFLCTPDALPTAGGGAIQLGRPSAGGTSLGGSRHSGSPGGTDGNRPRTSTRGHAGGHRGGPTGPPRGTDGNGPRTDI